MVNNKKEKKMRSSITNKQYRRVYKGLYDFVYASEHPCKIIFDELNGQPYIPVGKPSHLITKNRIETIWNCTAPDCKLYRAHLLKLVVFKHYYGYIYKTKVSAFNIDSFVIKNLLDIVEADYKKARDYVPPFSSTSNIYPISLSGMA